MFKKCDFVLFLAFLKKSFSRLYNPSRIVWGLYRVTKSRGHENVIQLFFRVKKIGEQQVVIVLTSKVVTYFCFHVVLTSTISKNVDWFQQVDESYTACIVFNYIYLFSFRLNYIF